MIEPEIVQGHQGDTAHVELAAHVASGRAGTVSFSRSYRERIVAPALIVGEVTPALLRAYFGQHVVLGTDLFSLRDAEILGEGIILTDGLFNVSSQLSIDADYPARHHRDLPERLPRLRRRAMEEEVVLLAGSGYRIYGHWIIDYLPKLYLLHLSGRRLDRLRFLLPADTPDFARDWLRRLGIDDGQLVLYDPAGERLACRRLLVPTMLRFLGRASPLLREARDFLMERAAPRRRRWWPGRARVEPGSRRILVVRSENGATRNRRRLAERAAFEAQAIARGFTPVHPEAMGVREQIALFRSAEVILGEYGSGLHGSVFSGPGAVVMALRNNAPGLGFLQSGIGQVLGHDTAYLIGSAPSADGSFSVAPEDIALGFDWLDWKRHG